MLLKVLQWLTASAATSMALSHCDADSTLNGQLAPHRLLRFPYAPGNNSEVIRVLWAVGLPGAEINRRLSAQYGISALARHRANSRVLTSDVARSPKLNRQQEN
jgi:hypothetical protein